MVEFETIAIVSGGFDPIHTGHLAMMYSASTLSHGKLIVGLNSDSWLERKKGKFFMPFAERSAIVQSMRYTWDTMAFDDSDDTAKDLLMRVRAKYPSSHIMFCNGGDRVSGNVPEEEIAASLNIYMHYGVGGFEKQNSSSKILADWMK